MRATLIPESYALLPQTTAPASPLAGQVYLDGSVSPPVYKQWNSVTLAWEEFGTGGGGGSAPVAAGVRKSALQSVPSGVFTQVTGWDTPQFDTASIWNAASSRFVIQSPGIYSVQGQLIFDVIDFSSSVVIAVYVNGASAGYIGGHKSTVVTANSQSVTLGNSASLQLAANDYVELFVFQDTGSTVDIVADSSYNFFQITRTVGAASGSIVSARAYQAASTAFSALAPIAFDTVEFDTSGALSAGVFTAPVSGKYQVSGAMQVLTGTDILLYKNGALKEYLLTAGPNTAAYSSLVSLVEGDTIDLRLAGADTVNGIPSTPVSYLNVALVSAIEPVLPVITRVFVNLSAITAVASNAQIIFDEVIESTLSGYNPATGEFTAPSTGLYSFIFNGQTSSATTAYLRTPGSDIYLSGLSTLVDNGVIEMPLLLNDVATLRIDGGVTVFGQSYPTNAALTWLQIRKIG